MIDFKIITAQEAVEMFGKKPFPNGRFVISDHENHYYSAIDNTDGLFKNMEFYTEEEAIKWLQDGAKIEQFEAPKVTLKELVINNDLDYANGCWLSYGLPLQDEEVFKEISRRCHQMRKTEKNFGELVHMLSPAFKKKKHLA